MKKNGKKIILIVILFCAFSVGLFYLVTVTTEKEMAASTVEEKETEKTAEAEENNADGSKNAEKTTTDESSSDQIEAAKALIGQEVTQEDIEVAVGEWDDFEMSSAGCERGVYAGKFYYEDFYIFSKTYDKGKTFTVSAVNE